MHPSNFELRLLAEDEEDFKLGLTLAFDDGEKALHWKIDRTEEGERISLFSGDPEDGATPLPYPMQASAAIPFLWNWLKDAKPGQEPDIDGSLHKGFLIEGGTPSWDSPLCRVTAVWAEYHK